MYSQIRNSNSKDINTEHAPQVLWIGLFWGGDAWPKGIWVKMCSEQGHSHSKVPKDTIHILQPTEEFVGQPNFQNTYPWTTSYLTTEILLMPVGLYHVLLQADVYCLLYPAVACAKIATVTTSSGPFKKHKCCDLPNYNIHINLR